MCLPLFIQCPNRMLQLYLRIKHKIEVDEEQWEFKLAGGEMSILNIYIGVALVKDKFDYCAIDRDLNIVCRKGNQKNNNSSFDSFLSVIKDFSGSITIGMESTGIYHVNIFAFILKITSICSFS